ncbi:MAG: SPOR domain-containing protein [Betaproteobacteria bacterium]|nr:SPOR domain-containing protein [Betaproteobacteria bacterium]
MKRPLTAQEQMLRIQSRRRMVGAFILMFVAVLLLPMMLNHATGPKLTAAPQPTPEKSPAAALAPAAAQPPVPEVAPAQTATATESMAPGPASPPAAAQAAPATVVAAPAVVPVAAAASAAGASSDKAAVPGPAVETPVTAAASPEAHREGGAHGDRHYLVQVGVFSDRRRAQALARKLEQEKLPVISEEVHYKEGTRVRVRLGPFEARADASNVVHRLDQMGIKSMMVGP